MSGISIIKELGKLAPYVRNKGRLRDQAAVKWPKQLFTKNTGLC